MTATSYYLKGNELTIPDFSSQNVTALYNKGYVFTRLDKGIMHQTRSLRIDLSKFELSSENRRILRKTDGLQITDYRLPISNYNWQIAKMAKDFYDTKFGKGVFSANKVKELLTDESRSNFNLLIQYALKSEVRSPKSDVGYAICYTNNDLLHYSYPFYDLKPNTYNLIPNLGMGMMLRAILCAKGQELKYTYLGSAQRQGDVYKLQFAGLEWFDGQNWQTNTNRLKQLLDLKSKI